MILLVFGAFSGRNIIITFIGFLLPYIYLALYYFWTDQLDQAIVAYSDFFGSLLGFSSGVDYMQYVVWSVLLFLMIFPAFFKITGTLSSYNINFRKKMGATNWFLVLSVPLIILSGKIEYNMVILIPASVIISHYFNIFKRSWWNETVLLVFLALIALHNYLNL
jgi:hypothetical protein